jgi:hypothetical protein
MKMKRNKLNILKRILMSIRTIKNGGLGQYSYFNPAINPEKEVVMYLWISSFRLDFRIVPMLWHFLSI